MPTNAIAKEMDRLSQPPGPPRRFVNGFAKRHYTERERAALQTMPVPFMLTVAAKKRLTTAEWLDLICTNLSPFGFDLTIDCFRQPRDRSVHVAIYGLPNKEAEASATTTLWGLCRSLGGRVGKHKSKAGRFIVPGLSLAYAWAHEDISSGSISGSSRTPA